jgi:hypothetical protein
MIIFPTLRERKLPPSEHIFLNPGPPVGSIMASGTFPSAVLILSSHSAALKDKSLEGVPCCGKRK